jgi:MFS family permease
MPASVLGLPFVDVAIKRFGWHTGFQVINVLAVAHGIIQVASDNLNVQVLGFVIFSFYRCFLFTVTFSFLPVFMGSDVLGKAAGLLIFFAGFGTLINIPLANVAIDVFNGNFFWSNLFYTILIIPFIYVAWKLEKGLCREKDAKDEKMPILVLPPP